MLAQGIRGDKACVLLAMDQLFDGEYEGREFIHDLFLEEFNETGFPSQYFYLLEESAPVIVIPDGIYTSSYNQGDTYWILWARDTNMRYRLNADSEVIYMYNIDEKASHAICIRVAHLNSIMRFTTYSRLILPTRGLIVDYKEFEE